MTEPASFPSTAPAIELHSLHKHYGAVRALAGVSLRVERGEVFGYLGANGAGKTTTIKVLTGLLRPTAGQALVCGFDVLRHPLQAKARIGYVPESGALFEKFSPREYLRLVGRLYRLRGDALDARVERLLGDFALAAEGDASMTALSKGQRQRVCWMAALLHEPDVLVLDEPLNGLDVESVARVKDLMRQRAERGGTVFYSSHLVDIVEKVCTRVAVLDAGVLVALGTVPEVLVQAGAGSLEEALLRLSAAAGRP